MTADEKRILMELMLDTSAFSRLDGWTKDVDLFEVLKITNMEIRHSNVLAWLLDPNQNHGLGSEFLRAFVALAMKNAEKRGEDLFQIWLLNEFDSFKVYREMDDMDIVVYSQKEKKRESRCLIIENKVWSDESKGQLEKYCAIAEKKYAQNKRLFVLLTPDGHLPNDKKMQNKWISISYEEVADILETVVAGKDLKEESRIIINNYIKTVRRNILGQRDEELITLCNEIYSNHRDALKLIYENVNIDNSIEAEVVCGLLEEFSNAGSVVFEDKNRMQFYTPKMDKYLPKLEKKESSWKTDRVYKYWFEKIVREDKDILRIHFELGGNHLTDELKEKTDKLIESIKEKGKKREKYKYYRLAKYDKAIEEGDYEEELRKAAKDLIEIMLDNEAKWLERLNPQEKND